MADTATVFAACIARSELQFFDPHLYTALPISFPPSLSLDSPFDNPFGEDFADLESWNPWTAPLVTSSDTLPPDLAVDPQPAPVHYDASTQIDANAQDIFQLPDTTLTYCHDPHQPQPRMSLTASTTTSPNSSAPSDSVSTGTSKASKQSLSRIEKRQQNTMAARRYRQRRVDQLKNLEEELRKVQQERDELRMRVSKLEGETEALRSLLGREKK
ncbi:bZIP transcription factor JlbA [Aspergillus terreus]|uniref:BZIP transcription factor JlbA n=1 Tax=Aspergillus terreus TaxID=33178 RepID=A0A5M3Z9X1_ASPTE|nr:hypothetical protein ATETN484_0012026000 [Aspergillus terreus]GFF19508.1 bZIP transcription factor JlbA [Aspergillus terreus]